MSDAESPTENTREEAEVNVQDPESPTENTREEAVDTSQEEVHLGNSNTSEVVSSPDDTSSSRSEDDNDEKRSSRRRMPYIGAGFLAGLIVGGSAVFGVFGNSSLRAYKAREASTAAEALEKQRARAFRDDYRIEAIESIGIRDGEEEFLIYVTDIADARHPDQAAFVTQYASRRLVFDGKDANGNDVDFPSTMKFADYAFRADNARTYRVSADALARAMNAENTGTALEEIKKCTYILQVTDPMGDVGASGNVASAPSRAPILKAGQFTVYKATGYIE